MEAARVASELSEQGIEATAIEGAKSQFDIVADGVVLFSKHEAGRFPVPGEITRLVSP